MTLKTTLAAGPMTATFASLKDPAVAGVLAQAGFGCIVIDREHAVMGVETAAGLIMASQRAGLSAITRIPELARAAVQDALEAGSDGILAPMVESAAQAKQLASWCRYPPEGTRGVHPLTPATGYGAIPMPQMFRAANQQVLVCAQIETAAGLEQAGAIAKTDGIDLLFFGPGDMAVSLGVGMDDPRLAEAFERVLAVAGKAGKLVGTFAMNAEGAHRAAAAGARLLVLGSDLALLKQPGTEASEGLKRRLQRP